MDISWALDQLRNWLFLYERVRLPPEEAKPNRKTRVRGSIEERANADNVARLIGETLFEEPPRWINENLVRTMIWELTEGDHARERLGLAGPAPPRISVDALHPWIWEAAYPHWMAENHKAALWAAAVNLNSRLQQKVGRKDLGEGKLLAECFSLDPPKPGRPRLRRCDESNPDLFRDMHLGALEFGKGLYSAVRNPINHVPEIEGHSGEIEYLEALAAFSLLARWIDTARVVVAE